MRNDDAISIVGVHGEGRSTFWAQEALSIVALRTM